MNELTDAVSIAIGQQRDLMFDPITAVLMLILVLAIGASRVLGYRKSTKRRIAEMADEPWPDDDPAAGRGDAD